VVKKRESEEGAEVYKKFNIEDLLLEMSIEFRNPKKAPGGWLPLEAYDNKELDTRAPKDWLVIKRDKAKIVRIKKPEEVNQETGEVDPSNAEVIEETDDPAKKLASKQRIMKTEIPAQGLWKDRADGLCFWRKLKIQKYLS